jgi:hypothetical protein
MQNAEAARSMPLLNSSFCLELRFRFGFAQAGDAVAVLPLAAFLEQFRALKTLEHIPFAAQLGSRAQTPML